MMQKFIDRLQAELPGYHFQITIYPAGGLIDADACDKCGTKESYQSGWNVKRQRKTIDDAIEHLKKQVSGEVKR